MLATKDTVFTIEYRKTKGGNEIFRRLFEGRVGDTFTVTYGRPPKREGTHYAPFKAEWSVTFDVTASYVETTLPNAGPVRRLEGRTYSGQRLVVGAYKGYETAVLVFEGG